MCYLQPEFILIHYILLEILLETVTLGGNKSIPYNKISLIAEFASVHRILFSWF